jgi:hypothetical protein
MVRFNSESCFQNYTEPAIISGLIEYDANIARDQDSSKNLVARYLRKKYTDGRENSKVYLAIIALVVKASLNKKENTNLPILY